jgi:2-polyprenyl-3-methyl-5-hydroxy-6-metoxy-1,4-benzoquinol methylase
MAMKTQTMQDRGQATSYKAYAQPQSTEKSSRRVKDLAKWRARQLIWRCDMATTGALRRNFTELDPTTLEQFRAHLLDHWSDHTYWESEVGREDLEEHTVGRLNYDRHEYVPWLSRLRRLDGAKILEIGCGTGSSVVALAEQGAELTGIDVVPEAIEMTRARIRSFGVDEPSLHAINGEEIDNHFARGSFDMVIFFASLEHMTLSERSTSLQAAWRLLADDGILCIIEAPNRLWPFDDHTANQPFFHWLPDEIALEYLKQSPRYGASGFDTASDGALLELSRRGRGVSYHDIELALGPIGTLDFEIDRQTFQMSQNPLRRLHYRQSTKRRFVSMLHQQRNDLPVGLFMPYLNVAIRKHEHHSIPERGATE